MVARERLFVLASLLARIFFKRAMGGKGQEAHTTGTISVWMTVGRGMRFRKRAR